MSLSTKKSSVDLLNVDYDDVLHLYRGWRRSESLLKDKNKEIATFKTKISQLQEAHSRFRGQIHALESVKELTIQLQTELSILQQDNFRLKEENDEFEAKIVNITNQVGQVSEAEKFQAKLLKETKIELSTIRNRYEETRKSLADIERLAEDEQAMRLSAEAKLNSTNQLLEELRIENKQVKLSLDKTTQRMSQCDLQLSQSAEQLANFAAELKDVEELRKKLISFEMENGLLRGDMARVVRLLDQVLAQY